MFFGFNVFDPKNSPAVSAGQESYRSGFTALAQKKTSQWGSGASGGKNMRMYATPPARARAPRRLRPCPRVPSAARGPCAGRSRWLWLAGPRSRLTPASRAPTRRCACLLPSMARVAAGGGVRGKRSRHDWQAAAACARAAEGSGGLTPAAGRDPVGTRSPAIYV